MSFRNRYIIAGANGLLHLTVPVKGGREQKTLMTEVRIDYTIDWQTKHWRSLVSAYSKAPFFEYYAEDIKKLLFSKEEFLTLFNIKILEWICKLLKIKAPEFTEEFIKTCSNATDRRNYYVPKSFQQNLGNRILRYSQMFEERRGFEPNLSIIDLLMCEGTNAMYLLRQNLE